MLGRRFVDEYYKISREKDSFLCVGLDPVTAAMREKNVIPGKLIGKYGVKEGIKKFCLEIIEAVTPYAPVIKPNAQFIVYHFSLDEK